MSGARNTARLPLVAAHTGHKSNHVRADDAPSLRSLGAAPGVEPLADLGRTLHPGLALGPIYGSAACLAISLRSKLAGNPAEDCTDRFKGLALRHGPHDGETSVRQVEQVYPNPGEVCRERG